MTKPVVAIDIDDVIADSTEALRRVVNGKLNTNLSSEDYKVKMGYDRYYNKVWEQHGLDGRINLADLQAEMRQDQSHIQLVGGAKAAIQALKDHYDIVLVTSRDAGSRDATERWLESHFGAALSGAHFVGNGKTATGKTKGEVCSQLGASVLIDDNPDYCRSAVKHGLDAILFGNYGWSADVPAGVVYCVDWDSVRGRLLS